MGRKEIKSIRTDGGGEGRKEREGEARKIPVNIKDTESCFWGAK